MFLKLPLTVNRFINENRPDLQTLPESS